MNKEGIVCHEKNMTAPCKHIKTAGILYAPVTTAIDLWEYHQIIHDTDMTDGDG